MTNHQLINQTSGNTEYYTPVYIIEAAVNVMGGIVLDPASSEQANKIVGARRFFTSDDNPLSPLKPWISETLWMNHPFSRGENPCTPKCKKKTCILRGYHLTDPIPGNADWINKLVKEFSLNRVKQAMCITFASTSESWFDPLFKFPMCFLSPRTNYLLPNGEELRGVTKGSVVTYLHRTREQFMVFCGVFSQYGRVVYPGYRIALNGKYEGEGCN